MTKSNIRHDEIARVTKIVGTVVRPRNDDDDDDDDDNEDNEDDDDDDDTDAAMKIIIRALGSRSFVKT